MKAQCAFKVCYKAVRLSSVGGVCLGPVYLPEEPTHFTEHRVA